MMVKEWNDEKIRKERKENEDLKVFNVIDTILVVVIN